MKVIAVLLLALDTASAGSLPNLTSIHPRDRRTGPSIEGRIIGGSPALPGQIPFQVGLEFIISPQWILTAAHCTDGDVTQMKRAILRISTHRKWIHETRGVHN